MALTRQIHLDFHCSEHIKEIGKSFNKKSFQEKLLDAKVNSINLFAKCHHSWSYYPTNIGQKHPHLSFDLLGAQIEACEEIAIKPFIYFTVGWSANDAENHPEWCARNIDGSLIINGMDIEEGEKQKHEALPNFYWKFMCVNTSYHDLVISQVEELCERYVIGGFWFDIYQVHRLCYCDRCKECMMSQGVDINDTAAVENFNAFNIKRHCRELRTLIQSKLSTAEVFFNGTTAIEIEANFHHRMYENNTIQDLEDLPTMWGGYDKLPLQAKFFLNAGYSITGMSGKFHTEWGEFGGFKHPDALKYEASSIVAFGANCNFGDQLHPNGAIDESTYENIGHAYDYVQQIEAYGIGGKPISRLGLWRSFVRSCDEGLSRMLLEKQLDFDVVNFCEDFSKYEVIIFPSGSELSQIEIDRVKEFIKNGGSVISLAKSLSNFLEDGVSADFGLEYCGSSDFDSDYTLVKESLYPVFVKTPFLNYLPAIKTKPVSEIEILADIYEPLFNRTLEHYCSHQKSPYKETRAEYPAVIKYGKCIFFAHELDSLYYKYGARIHRDLFVNCLKIVYDNPYVKVDLPSAARINLLHQENKKRYVLHVLYSSPIFRGVASVIEDCVPIINTAVAFQFPKKIQSVYLVPNRKKLKIVKEGAYYFVNIPEFNTHCALIFNY